MAKNLKAEKLLYRLNLRTLEDPAKIKFLIDNNVIGLGYKVDTDKEFNLENIEEYRTLALEKYPKDARKINTFVNVFKKINKGDILWARIGNRYFVGEITDLWSYGKGKDFDKHDLHNIVKLDLKEIPTDRISKTIIGSFIGGGIIQKINSQEALDESLELLKEDFKAKESTSKEIQVKENKVKVYSPDEHKIIKVLEKIDLETEKPEPEKQMNFGDIVIEVYPQEDKEETKVLKKNKNIPPEKSLVKVHENINELESIEVLENYFNLQMEMRHYYLKYLQTQMELFFKLNYYTMYMEGEFLKLMGEMYKNFFQWK